MRPDHVDLLTWALLMFLMADHAGGALGGLYVVGAVVLIVLSHMEVRKERRQAKGMA